MNMYRIFATLVFVASVSAAEKVNWKSVGLEVQIVGKLGVPLGYAVEIEATIVAGRTVMSGASMSLQSAYILKVNEVAGRALAEPQLTLFLPWSHDVKLATHTFALYELKEGRKATSLSPEQIQEIEKDYVGRRYRLLVFEEGRFDGYPPQNLPEEEVEFIQKIVEPGLPPTRSVRFRPIVRVLRIIEPNKTPEPTPTAAP